MLPAKYIHINMDKNKRPKLYTLPDALRWQSSPTADTIVYLISGANRRSVFSVWACVSVRRVLYGLPCIWHGLCCCLCCAVRPDALEGAAVHRRGI